MATSRSSRLLNPAAISEPELVHRRVEPGRVEQQRELGRVAVEVAFEHPADAPDGAVALGLVEQLVDHRAQRAAVAEEPLEGPRQPAVAVGEVRPQGLLERLGGALVDLLGLADHPLELGADGVDVDGHAGVLEGDQPDAQGALDEGPRSSAGRSPRNAARVGSRQGQAVDDDPVALETDRGVERDDGCGGFHARNVGPARDS